MLQCTLPLQVDASDFSEIATTCTEGRCVLDLCVDAADAFIGVVSVEPNELMSSSARVYEVGRRRIQVARPPRAVLGPGHMPALQKSQSAHKLQWLLA